MAEHVMPCHHLIHVTADVEKIQDIIDKANIQMPLIQMEFGNQIIDINKDIKQINAIIEKIQKQNEQVEKQIKEIQDTLKGFAENKDNIVSAAKLLQIFKKHLLKIILLMGGLTIFVLSGLKLDSDTITKIIKKMVGAE